jgi:hypothetical protein
VQPPDNLTISAVGIGGAPGKISSQHVTLDTVKLLIKHIVLMPTGSMVFPDFKTGPYVIVLGSTPVPVIVGNLTTGSYDRIKFEIHKPDANEVLPDPDFRDGPQGNDRYSLIIIGRYQGSRFVFKSRSTINQTLTLDTPLLIDESTVDANVTLQTDLTTWFTGGSGELDPTDTQPSNVAAIEKSIRDSFKAFRDDDRNGLP